MSAVFGWLVLLPGFVVCCPLRPDTHVVVERYEDMINWRMFSCGGESVESVFVPLNTASDTWPLALAPAATTAAAAGGFVLMPEFVFTAAVRVLP